MTVWFKGALSTVYINQILFNYTEGDLITGSVDSKAAEFLLTRIIISKGCGALLIILIGNAACFGKLYEIC